MNEFGVEKVLVEILGMKDYIRFNIDKFPEEIEPGHRVMFKDKTYVITNKYLSRHKEGFAFNGYILHEVDTEIADQFESGIQIVAQKGFTKPDYYVHNIEDFLE